MRCHPGPLSRDTSRQASQKSFRLPRPSSDTARREVPQSAGVRTIRLPVTTALALVSLASTAAPVSLGFEATVSRVNGPVPAGIIPGTPVEVILTYDPAAMPAPSVSPATVATYYPRTPDQFRLWMRAGSWEATTVVANPDQSSFNLGVKDGLDGKDEFSSDMLSPGIWAQHVPPTGDLRTSMALYLSDNSATVFHSLALPLSLPDLAAFSSRRLSFGGWTVPANGPRQSLWGVSAEITGITTPPRPPLTLLPLPDGSWRVSWPQAAIGFSLETAGSPTASTWTTVAIAETPTETEHVVIVPDAPGPRFFRLRQIP